MWKKQWIPLIITLIIGQLSAESNQNLMDLDDEDDQMLDQYANMYKKADTDTMVGLMMILRPGAQTPGENFYRKSSKQEQQPELTKEGRKQMRRLGSMLKKRYGSYLKDQTRSQINVRSVFDLPALDSANILTDQIWHSTFGTANRLVVKTLPNVIDSVLSDKSLCPNRDQSFFRNLNTNSTFQQFVNQPSIQNLLDTITNNTGMDRNLNSLVDITNSLLDMKVAGLPLPEWANTNDTLDQLTKTAIETIRYRQTIIDTVSFTVGPLLSGLRTYVQAILSDQGGVVAATKQAASLLIADTSKITGLLGALGETIGELVPPAGTVLAEVHSTVNRKDSQSGRQNDLSDLIMKVFYIDQTAQLPFNIRQLPLTSCLIDPSLGECLVSNLLDTLKPLLNVDWLLQCGIDPLVTNLIQVAEDGLNEIFSGLTQEIN